MTRTTRCLLGVVALVAIVAAISGRSSSRRRGEVAAPTATAATAMARSKPTGDRVRRSRYHVRYEQRASAAGAEFAMVAEGAWVETTRRDGRVDVRFEPTRVDGPDLPPASELDVTAQLVTTDATLTAMGFSPRATLRSKRLLTALATTVQLTERPGATWAASEEDLMGRYQAGYRRLGDEVERTRSRYLAARQPSGLSPGDGPLLTPTERTRFVVDGDGVVRATIELTVEFRLDHRAPVSTLRLTASLVRTAVDQIATADGPELSVEPIAGHADFDGASRNADESFVAGASLEELLVAAHGAIARGRDGGNDRAQALSRIASLVRLDPEVAAEVAAWVLAHQDQVEAVQLVTGALASTGVAAGTNALATLADAALAPGARDRVLAALALSEPATPESLAALTRRLDDPEAVTAPIGLGTHARLMSAADPAAATAAAELLVARYSAARDPAVQLRYLHAMGNSGSARTLTPLRAAIERGDLAAANVAAYALRLIPGPEADALIEHAIARPDLAIAAVRAIGFRDPSQWSARLDEVGARYADNNVVQGELRQLRRVWSLPAPI